MFLTGETQRSSSSTATGNSSGSAARSASASGLFEQGRHAAADDVTRGLVPTDEDEQRLVHDGLVVETDPVDLGLAQLGDEVVARLGPALVR